MPFGLVLLGHITFYNYTYVYLFYKNVFRILAYLMTISSTRGKAISVELTSVSLLPGTEFSVPEIKKLERLKAYCYGTYYYPC